MAQALFRMVPGEIVDERIEVPTRVRGLAFAGFAVIAVFVGAFAAWSWFAPLAVGAHASGIVKVETDRKRVQHLEGGIVKEILVKDGDQVAAGQLLIRLDDTKYRASLNILTDNYMNALANAARLEAEQKGAPTIEFSEAILERSPDPRIAAIMHRQTELFQARRSALDAQLVELKERVTQARAEIRALETAIQAQIRQEGGFREEIGSVNSLIIAGYERKPRLLALQRALAGAEAGRSTANAEIAKARQKIAESEQMIAQLNGAFVNEVANQLKDQQTLLFELRDRMAVVRDAVSRLDVAAPRDGTVLGLRFFTVGAVVAPGETLLELVPRDDRLVIEARLDPRQSEHVVPGLSARVRLLPFSTRRTPLIDGKVLTVSADTVQEAQPGSPLAARFYVVRVELDGASLARAGDLRLQAGMPADVLIDAGERSLAEYLLEPVYFGVLRAFREH